MELTFVPMHVKLEIEKDDHLLAVSGAAAEEDVEEGLSSGALRVQRKKALLHMLRSTKQKPPQQARPKINGRPPMGIVG